MASASLTLENLFGRNGLQQIAGPILIMLVLSMMVLPLPPFMLDLFFTFNIAISVIVMLVVIALSVNLLGDWLRDVFNPKIYKG